MRTSVLLAAALAVFALSIAPAHAADFEGELIFPAEHWHNHGSCIVECSNGDLLACWFHGSGERTADDVAIYGARRRKGEAAWCKPFVMADVPGFPDTNCCMIIDPQGRLWLLWPTILAHSWESALMKYKISTNYMLAEGPPKWDSQEVLHIKPVDNFAEQMETKFKDYTADAPQGVKVMANVFAQHNIKMAKDLAASRIGWFTRAHPIILPSGRMLVGLYSDGFSNSLVAYTDDGGANWGFSEPIVGGGNIQPSFARRTDGTIVTYMRDNGPPPKRVMVSESKDEGVTWSRVTDHPVLPNPGSGLEVMNFRDQKHWAVIYNDTEDGRHSLAVSLSEDEGREWKWTRHVELSERGVAGYGYPSIIEAADGTLHATYTHAIEKPVDGSKDTKSIKHVHFTTDWIKAGDTAPGGVN